MEGLKNLKNNRKKRVFPLVSLLYCSNVIVMKRGELQKHEGGMMDRYANGSDDEAKQLDYLEDERREWLSRNFEKVQEEKQTVVSARMTAIRTALHALRMTIQDLRTCESTYTMDSIVEKLTRAEYEINSAAREWQVYCDNH